MPSDPDALRTAVEHYAATVNGRDPEAIAGLFAEDAVQADPASGPPNTGRQAIAAFFAAGIAASDDWTFTATDVHTCGTSVAFAFRIAVDMGGGRMLVDGIEVMTVADDGLIASAHAYWDDTDVSFA